VSGCGDLPIIASEGNQFADLCNQKQVSKNDHIGNILASF